MADRQHSQSRALNLGLAAAAVLVLAVMCTVVGVAVTAAEPDGAAGEREFTPAMWQEPPPR